MIGRTLGPYELVGKLGEGGMGEVYRARDTRLDRDVALKALPAALATSPDVLERFRREARAVAALNHPNIVTIHSVEAADGVHFLTMELVEGEPLADLIPEGGMETERMLAIADALAAALTAAHEKGIVHRDLKPANVMVTKDGGVKVLDFGLAKVQDPAGGVSEAPTAMHTAAGVVMGTRPYMSPEQIQGRELDHRTDIFSLGVVLFEMATGTRPFEGPSPAELFASILRDVPPPVTDVRAGVPAEFSRVTRRCLEKDPRDRIQTARDVARLLRERTRPGTEAPRPVARPASGIVSADEGFRVAVLPFKASGTDSGLAALGDGLTEEIGAGLSRFSYLRVLTREQSGARYVLEGSVRQAAGQVRVAARVIDTSTGANLWAENYTRPYSPDTLFQIQDSLTPSIVSTIADMNGVLAHSMWIALRDRNPETLTPYEAMLRSFGFYEHFTRDEYRLALAGLKQAIAQAPNHSGCLAMLAIVHANGHLLGFGTDARQADLGVAYGQRAVAAESSNHWAYFALAEAHVARKDLPAFRNAAERALALNPLDGGTMGGLALWIAYTGNWQRGRELMERAMALNTRHPRYFWYPLVHDAYRQKNYARALDYAVRVNLPGQFWTHLVLAMVHGQLGNRDAAADALSELLVIYPDLPDHVRQEMDKFFFAEPGHAEHVLEGLRKAGLNI